jgi:hypothetical protein
MIHDLKSMTRFLLLCAIACVIAVGSACDDGATGTSPTDRVSIETDKTVYSLASDSFAIVTLTNRVDRTLYLPMGEYLAYERLVDGEWRDGYAWFTVDGIGRSFSIEPMASQDDQLELWAYLAGQPGTYRFQYFVYISRYLGGLLPLEERVSAPFVVTP